MNALETVKSELKKAQLAMFECKDSKKQVELAKYAKQCFEGLCYLIDNKIGVSHD